ncbi:winged helix-turn-helix transcriptional regulator [Ralstonia nicotianae]|nr:helix-turn-helix domain-containing protein [Ralstonia pseudosolanacearum]OHU95654.1 transcriptional regulator [Ralstonia solanacearum]
MTIPQERIYQILSRMGGKWTILAISVLAEQPRRVNELKRLIGGISQQMLTRTLKALEHDGMVTWTVPPTTVPPQVEYALTELGTSPSGPLLQLAHWVLDHLGEIEAHQALHDEKTRQLRA